MDTETAKLVWDYIEEQHLTGVLRNKMLIIITHDVNKKANIIVERHNNTGYISQK
jgi:hypothetical protein